LRSLLIIGFLCLIFSGCSRDPEITSNKKKIFFIPEGFPIPVYNLSNNFNETQFQLGKKLFFDPILSEDMTVSCSSCHLPEAAFSDPGNAFSTGINNSISKRNSPALINLAWQTNFMWDGGVNHIEIQPLAPLTNPDEMGSDLAPLVDKLNQNSEYKILFKKAFDTDSITSAFIFKSLAHFMSCLISCESKYDQFKRGEINFTWSELNGLNIFQQNCSSCHKEPLFTDLSYRNNGIGWNTSSPDAGRFIITQVNSDSLKFKVPTLRNIELTFPYMHDGRINTLEEVINHYASGNFHANVDSEINSISLSPSEKLDLLSFLKTLTDEEFINNPNLKP
jgi:cytochrome c peroxidase